MNENELDMRLKQGPIDRLIIASNVSVSRPDGYDSEERSRINIEDEDSVVYIRYDEISALRKALDYAEANWKEDK
jgi:hypothetical protein